MKCNYVFCLIVCCFFLKACLWMAMDYSYSIAFDNQYNKDLCVKIDWSDFSGSNNLDLCPVGERTWCFITSLRSWKEAFKQCGDTLYLYIIEGDSVEKYKDWETIFKKNAILHRYDLIYKNVKELDAEISYPPTPAMRDIKMWPPYSTFEK